MKTAYPSLMGTCDIYLYANIPFDNSYAHHTLISKKFTYNSSAIYNASDSLYGIACERFLNRRDPDDSDAYYYPRWKITGDFNFNFSNGLIASVVLELTPAQTNANYLKLVTGNDVYYYFVTAITQSNFDTYTLSLELDVLMTYQDEFLTGMQDVPVFTNRKMSHRFTNDGIVPKCCDYKTGEDTFAGVTPTIVSKKTSLKYPSGELKNIKDIKWLYICSDGVEDYGMLAYKNQKVCYPFSMLAMPVNVEHFIIVDNNNVELYNVDRDDILKCINKYLIGSGHMFGAKISNYPPFTSITSATYDNVTGTLTLKVIKDTDYTAGIYKVHAGNNYFAIQPTALASTHELFLAMANGCICITEQDDCSFNYDGIRLFEYNATAPTITSDRVSEPKLLFKPFKKYVLNAKYSSEGNEIYPELLYSDGVIPKAYKPFMFTTITSAYIGDNNIFTHQRPFSYTESGETYYFFNNYQYQKIGLACCMNYNFPVGTDALAVFNATQSQSFYQSKVASGITSGLAIAGGIASIVVGAGMTVGSKGTLSPVGAKMIMGGATAIASGVAGEADTIKSTMAKKEDLKNTPDSINISGSNYITDYAVVGEDTPFVIEYECSSVVKESAEDFFYQYGYQVGRDCYFNTEIKYNNDVTNQNDNNLFGRTILNYVQINEDITNKIDADIPYAVKKKLSSIFNNGITLWTFFGFQQFWRTRHTPSAVGYKVERFFMKHQYDNTEYDGSIY